MEAERETVKRNGSARLHGLLSDGRWTVATVTSQGVALVGEAGMRIGCGHDADRFAMVFSAQAIRFQVGPTSQMAT